MPINERSYIGPNPSQEILDRISEVINFSITDFSDPKFNYMKDTCEILKLLFKIEDTEDRLKVLAFVRTIADRYPN